MNKQKGFVHLIIIVLIALIAFSYFGVDLEQVFAKPLFKKNLLYTWNTVKTVWTDYIYDPLTGLFNKNSGNDLLRGTEGGTVEK